MSRRLRATGLAHQRRADAEGADIAPPQERGVLGEFEYLLDETSRRYAWACRYEPKGSEQHAWLRAMAQIDGCVFEGAPAPPRVEPARRRPASRDVDAKSRLVDSHG